MIVVDTSAAVAILEQESDASHFMDALVTDGAPIMSAATFVELNAIMRHKRGSAIVDIIDRFIAAAAIQIEPLTPDQALIARDAYHRFGALNFGDTFAYALAKDKDVPLLFKGDDFSKTDVTPCL